MGDVLGNFWNREVDTLCHHCRDVFFPFFKGVISGPALIAGCFDQLPWDRRGTGHMDGVEM